MRALSIQLQSVLIVLAALFSAACAQGDRVGAERGAAQNTVVIESGAERHRFYVEIADDDEERRIGLMYRTELAQDAGMLFDFGEPQQLSMWMKNTLIPLDIAFIDKEGVIRRIAANTTPRSLESIRSGAAVVGVLEVNGGVFERLGVKEGDIVRHPIFNND